MAIEVQVVSNSQAARQDLAKLSQSVDNINKSVEQTTSQFKEFAKNLAISVVSAATLVSLTRLSDELTSLDSKLKVSVEDLGSFNEAMKTTKRIAMDTGNQLSTVGTLYSKLAMSSKELGASQKQVGIVTSNVAKALALSGATITESTAAIMQLGQAMASGKLQGDELRSILENAPQLGKAIAEGLGVALGDLRRLGEEGSLTADLVFGALLEKTDDLNEKFKKVGITFGTAFTNIGNATKVLFLSIRDFGKLTTSDSDLADGSRTLAQTINDAAKSFYKFADTFEIRILKMRTSFWAFTSDITNALGSIPKALGGLGSTGLGKIFSAFENMRKINIMEFIPNLAPALKTIKDWVISAERAFFWLYDKVIGHSWIPDLVEGIRNWMERLNKEPLKLALEFIGKLTSEFKSLTEKTLGIPFVDNLITRFEKLKDVLNNTTFMRNLKQVFGFQETTAGTYSNRTVAGGTASYDLSSFVGRGPQRNKENRSLLHDVTNAFSSENQIPFLAALTSTVGAAFLVAVQTGSFTAGLAAAVATGFTTAIGGMASGFVPIGVMIGGAILATFSDNTTVKVLAAVLTTAFGLAVSANVSSKEISLTSASIANTVLEGIRKGVRLLFGEGILGDSGLSSILIKLAKVALLFEAGRKAIGGMAIKMATAPTKIADAVTDVLQKKVIDVKARTADKEAAKLLNEHTDTLNRYSKNVRTDLRNLQKINSANGILFPKGSNRALMKAIGSNDPLKIASATKGLDAAGLKIVDSLKANMRGYEIANKETGRINEAAGKFKSAADNLKNVSEGLGKRIAETREATQRGLMTTAGTIGGIFGTLAGVNLGGQIADQMVGYSDWAKVGVQISAAMLGQGIGAAIGQGIARTFIMSIGLITTPIGLAIAAGAAALYAVYKTFQDPAWVVNAYTLLLKLGDEWAKMIVNAVLGRTREDVENIEKQKDVVRQLGDQLSKALAKGDKETAKELAASMKTERDKLVSLGGKSYSMFGIDKQLEGMLLSMLPDSGTWEKFKKLPETILDFLVGKAEAADLGASRISENADKSMLSLKDTFSDFKTFNAKNTSQLAVPSKSSDVVPINEENFNKLVAVIRSNEGSKSSDISPMGAKGTMQITEGTFNMYKKAGESFDKEADRVSAALRKLWDDFTYYGGNIRQTAAAYHAGRWDSKRQVGGVMPSGEINPNSAERFRNEKGEITRIGTYTTDYADKAVNKFNNTVVSKVKDTFGSSKVFLEDLYNTAKSDGFEAALKKLTSAFKDVAKKGTLTFEESLESAKTAEDQLKLYNDALTKIGIDVLSMKEFEEADQGDLDKIAMLITNWQESQLKLAENVANGWTGFELKFKRLSKESSNAIKNIRKEIKVPEKASGDESWIKDYGEPTKAWSLQAWKNLNTGLADNLKATLKGEMSISDFGNNIAGIFANTIVEGFSKGLAQQLLVPLDTMLPKIFSNVFNIGGMLGDATTYPVESVVKGLKGSEEVIKEGTDTVAESVTDSLKENLSEMPSWFDDLWGTIKGGFGTLISGLGSVLSSISGGVSGGMDWISGLFSVASVAAATGGYISGPGTGTSDSIPAMLSNGEYVVNAKQASKFAPLLSAINSGTLSYFADGGVAGISNTSNANTALYSSSETLAPSSNSLDATVLTAISGISEQITQSTSKVLSSVNTINSTLSGVAAMQGITNMQLGLMQMMQVMNQGALALDIGLIKGQLFGIYNILIAKPMATGGWVSGPGTGTSDSIPARLSNGEFVVKAKQASKFAPLLQAINENQISHFADGGFAGISAVTNTPTIVPNNENTKANSSQVFNINITGDINRQTRQEVLRMIPQIATGVNQSNYETGYVSKR